MYNPVKPSSICICKLDLKSCHNLYIIIITSPILGTGLKAELATKRK